MFDDNVLYITWKENKQWIDGKQFNGGLSYKKVIFTTKLVTQSTSGIIGRYIIVGMLRKITSHIKNPITPDIIAL